MQKTFDIIIDDQQPVNPNNSFAIYRGDNVAFNFTFQRGGTALDVEGSTLRIFAKKLGKNGLDKLSNPLFAGDFVESNTATFDSSQTSGDAGNYVLSVLLMSSENAVVTSQCIYFELKENGYAGYYQPSQDYRDEIFEASQSVIDAKAEAKQYSESAKTSEENAKASETNAKDSENTARALSQYAEQYSRNAEQSANDCAEAVAIVQSAEGECLEAVANAEYFARQSKASSDKAIAISDPEGFRTSTAESIANLSEAVVGKVNRGELYLNCGSLTTTKKDSLLNPFSYVWTMSMSQEEFIKHKGNSPAFFGNENYFGSPITYQGWAVCRTSDTNVLFGMSGINTSSGYTYTNVNVLSYLDGNSHVWAVVYTGNQLKLIVDGNVLSTISATFNVEQSRIPFQIGQGTLTTTATHGVWGVFSRIKYFNFDITSDDAPYTLADYVNGKDESLNTALLSLADYTFNGKVLDNSGNGNHATITGDVAGTHDNAVESFYQQVAVRIQNLIKG